MIRHLLDIDNTNVELFRKLVNAAKTEDFHSIPEAVRTIFINELDVVRTYIDKLIKQPPYQSGWIQRTSDPDDIERKILTREFKITNEPDSTVQDLVDKYTLYNLDYYKFLYILGDVFAAIRTINILRKDITNPFKQPIKYINEYHKSFGFDIYKIFPQDVRRALLSKEMSVIKKKGTAGLFALLLEALGYNNIGIAGYWLDKEYTTGDYKLFARLITKNGNPLLDALSYLDEWVDDIEDSLWYLTNSDLLSLEPTNNYVMPARAPYIGLLLGINLADMYTTNSYLFGSIMFATVVYRGEMESVRNIGINSYGKDISISELYLAFTWLMDEYTSWNPFTPEEAQYLYIWNGRYKDDEGNVLDDDTLTRDILNRWLSIFNQRNTIYVDKAIRQRQFREYFQKISVSDKAIVSVNPKFELPFIQFVLKSDNKDLYPEEFIDVSGNVYIKTNSNLYNTDIIVSALDSDTYGKNEYYLDDEYTVLYELPYKRTIDHNLDNQYNIVVQYVLDKDLATWHMSIPGQVNYVNENTLTVTNNSPDEILHTFKVRVYKPDYIEDITPTSSNNLINIVHNLNNQYPVVQIIDVDNKDIVFPDYIEFTDENYLKIKFTEFSFNKQYKVLIKKANTYEIDNESHDRFNLIADNVSTLAKTVLQERNSDFYNYLYDQVNINKTYDRLLELVEALEVYMYDVTNIYFPFRQFLFGIRDDVYTLFNWVKPYHVKLLKVIEAEIINDPVNDAMLVGDDNLGLAIYKYMQEYVYMRCRYDIGGIYHKSKWKYDSCRTPDDSYLYVHVLIKILDGFRSLRYDTQHNFDYGYMFDLAAQVSDVISDTKIKKRLEQNIEQKDSVYMKVKSELSESYSLSSDTTKLLGSIKSTDLIDVDDNISHLNAKYSFMEVYTYSNDSGDIFVEYKVPDETISTSDLVDSIIFKIRNTESISVDDSQLTITVS